MTGSVSTVLDDQEPTVPGSSGGTGHLEECRSTRSGCSTGSARSAATSAASGWPTSEVVLVTGAEANEAFFRAPDDDLDQAAAYPFMTPIFGKGVVFDASPEERSRC